MTQAAPQAAPKPAPWPAMSIQQAYALITAPGSPGEMEEVEIRGVKTRVWKHAPPTLRHTVMAGRAHGEKIFLVHEDERVSFEAFYRAVTQMAAELEAFGVKKGDRVAIVMRNLPEWPVAFYAAVSLGAIVTPLNAWWTGPELEYGLADSEAKVAIVDVERFERLIEHLHNCPALERVYVSRSKEEIAHPYVKRLEGVIGCPNDWIKLEEKPLPTTPLAPDDDATIFYTSGTTGKPKGAIGTHRNVNSNIFATAAASARAFLR
ncbi:MAG TPA: AMP-binding protein, partial [Caulobacter sp.]|nr:AMP-binding protein [Caulobacter sp.]